MAIYASVDATHYSVACFILFFVDLGNLTSEHILSFQDSLVVPFIFVTHDLQFLCFS
jgi:hypothetical protein